MENLIANSCSMQLIDQQKCLCGLLLLLFVKVSPGLLIYDQYQGPGTTDEIRIEACARGCLARVAVGGWSNYPHFVLRGFFVWPQTGACTCTASISSICEAWKVTDNTNVNFKRYDFAATDNRHPAARTTAFSNECSTIFTWPWLWREPSGGVFLELDGSVNWAMANGWNAGVLFVFCTV
jgi:hypothetical protein